MNHPNFLVSIRCMTYNHAPFIEDAMNGFCMQQTTFPFVAIIVDDASTDGEPEVIKSYLNEHFDMSKARHWVTEDAHFIEAHHKENTNCTFAVILLKYNFWQAKKDKNPLIKDWMDCKYIALCEGDDYWTDKMKLHSQVEIFKEHPEYGMIYTNHLQYIQSEDKFINGWSIVSNFDDMLLGNKICTLTVCMTKALFLQYFKIVGNDARKQKWLMGDYPLWLFSFAESKVFFLDKITGTYRVLQNSASHFNSFKKRERFILSTMDIQLFFAKKYKKNHAKRMLVTRNLSLIAHESDMCNQNTKTIFLPYFLKYRFSIRLFVSLISTHNRYSRFLYHKCFGW